MVVYCRICEIPFDDHTQFCSKCGESVRWRFEKSEWKTTKPIITDDKLVIFGFDVMERWEEPYMKHLADIITRYDGEKRILEVGFGLGISASYIASHESVIEHVIIEANHEVFNRAAEFSQQMNTKKFGNSEKNIDLTDQVNNNNLLSIKSREFVKPIHGLWEEVIDQLPRNYFDGILFDVYPNLPEEMERTYISPFFEVAYDLLKEGGIFTYYSDESKELPEEHRKKLSIIGFKKISFELCPVNPPKDCTYWNSSHFVCPIAIK